MAYRASIRTVHNLFVSPRVPVTAQRQLSTPPTTEGNNDGAKLLKSTSMEQTTRRAVSGTTPQTVEGAQKTGTSGTLVKSSIITKYVISPELLKNLPDKAIAYPDTEFREEAYSRISTGSLMEKLPISASVWPHLW